jgi:hypothetical protein
MPINTETLNRKLYNKLSKYSPKPMDASGKVTPIEDEADVFKFTFTKDGQPYGDVFATVDDDRRLVLYYGDDVAESPDAPTPGVGYNDTWIGFVEDLKSWKTRNGFKGWQLKNQDHLAPDMARRNHMNKKDKLGESYYAMGKKASYSDAIPTIKMVIQHTRQIEEGEQRYRNIAKIFLENQEGERFLAPTTKPGIARVYARHIAEGGKPHDERWNHIGSLCEEYQKMAGFVRATRNHQFNESAQKLVESGIQHYQSLRESLSKMTGHRGYNSYFESWTPPLMEDEADMSSINELFVQETLDPRIESVMPILSKLHKTVAEMKEVDQLSEWADSLLEMEEPEAYDDFASDTEGDEEKQSRLEELYDRKFYIESYIDNPEVLEPEELDGMQAELETINDEITELGGLNEEESRTSNNPMGIPEGEEYINPVVSAITRRIMNQRPDLLKHGPVKVMQAIDDVADFVGDVEEIGSSDVSGWVKQVEQSLGGVDEGIIGASIGKALGTAAGSEFGPPGAMVGGAIGSSIGDKITGESIDTLKKFGGKVLDKLGHGSDEELLKKLQKDAGIPASAQHGKPNMAKPNEEEVDESALQASFGIKKYGKDGMQKLQQLGREHASKATIAKAKAEYTSEDLDADQKRVGQLGPTSKVKNNNIGKLVGANESASTTHKGGKVTSKDGVTKHQSGPGTYGGYDDSTHPDSPEEKHTSKPGATTGHRTDKIKKHKDVEENFIGMAPQAVAEGQDDLNAIKRLLGK